jgi:RNA polymerase sigma factor (sigma-70 family)
MKQTLRMEWVSADDKQRISDHFRRERGRLLNFIRKRVADENDAEDILQEAFYELVEAYRLMKPVERVGAWLFRVARNRITDRFRKRKPGARLDLTPPLPGDDESFTLDDLLPSPEAGPEAEYARRVLLEELDAALDELPDEQREVFVAHELEGRSFKEMAEETGVGVATLLSRKHYAVLHLRKSLQAIYDEFTQT